jgi:hypothetical protein
MIKFITIAAPRTSAVETFFGAHIAWSVAKIYSDMGKRVSLSFFF